MGETRGRFKSRNKYKRPMDKDNREGGLKVEGEGLVGQGRVMGW